MPHDIDQILTRLQPGKFDAQRAANFDLERAKGALESFVAARDMTVDRETRIATISLATDQPIEHWFGMLTLDVSKKAVVLDRVNNGVAPLLVNHDRSIHPGVLVANSVELGPVIHCQAKFSRSQLGEDMLNDVEDEIRVGTSVGFMVHDLVLENEKEVQKGAIPMYRATKWEILEVSLASVPADINCGTNRTFEKVLEPGERAISTQENTMPEQDNPTPGTPVEKTPEQLAREAKQATANEIRETAAALGMPDAEHKFYQKRLLESIAGEPTVDEFKAYCRGLIPASQTPPAESPEAIAARAGVKTELAHSLPRNRSLTTFKGENGVERAYRFGMWALGRAFYDPNAPICVTAAKWCDDNKLGLQRAMSEGVNESGGYTVPPEFSNDIIDLREEYGVFRQYAKVVPMASDTLSIPRRVGGLTAYFVSEAGSLTASDKAWDQVELVAKKMACLARYSTEVNEDSIVDFASDLAAEIAYAFANKEDECGFNGDGTSTYGKITGVRQSLLDINSTSGGAGLVLATGHNAYSELVLTEFESVVGALPQYADPNAKWFVHRSFYWNVMVKLLLASGGVTATEIENARKQIFMGYPVVFSQVMPSTEANSQVCALFGDLSKAAILGTRRDVTIMTSEHSRFANDQIEIKGTERFDIAVHGVGTSTVAGPIVGLLTAAS